jgi:DNA-binding Lrp family transcriptional regulator
MPLELDTLDQRLLNAAQRDFPLCERPWAALGEPFGLDEDEVLGRFRHLQASRVLRQISAIFDSKALGYCSALVAAQAPGESLEACAGIVSAHAGVSHNYQREHAFNLWFTLAVPCRRDLQSELDHLGRSAGLLRWQLMPALRTFRIGVAFDLEKGKAGALDSAPHPVRRLPSIFPGPEDEAAVRATQDNLLLVPRPFEGPARFLGWSQEDLFIWLNEAKARGWLRRFAAVLRHREAGFGEGGMGVWSVPPDGIERVGQAFAQDPAVTHCYERPSFEGWPYNLFTMVHGQDRESCQAALDGLAARVNGWTRRSVLFSTREFKKERVRYFLEASHATA